METKNAWEIAGIPDSTMTKEKIIEEIIEGFAQAMIEDFDQSVMFDKPFTELIESGSVINVKFSREGVTIRVRHKEIKDVKPDESDRERVGFAV
jgi:hypothetical protein